MIILIKYTTDQDFKKYGDFYNYESFEDYEKIFEETKETLRWKTQEKIVELDFDEKSYLEYVKKMKFIPEGDYDDFDENGRLKGYWKTYYEIFNLSQLEWAVTKLKRTNKQNENICRFCEEKFQARKDAKFCSNICRSKNYRTIRRTNKSIQIAKNLGLDHTNQDVLNRINKQSTNLRIKMFNFSKDNEFFGQYYNPAKAKKYYLSELGF